MMVSIFLAVGCSHIQKIHYYNVTTVISSESTKQPVFTDRRSFACPLLPIPWSPDSTQSKVSIANMGEEFQLSVSVDLNPLTLWKDVYWWGPLFIPIVPTFVFTEKSDFKELPIKVEYKRKWKTEFKKNDVELTHKRFQEIRESSFPQPNHVTVRFMSASGNSETMVLQGSRNKYNDSDTQFYRYNLSLNSAIPESFEVDVEIKDKTYTFILQNQERWNFAIYAPFYCGLN